MTLVPWLDRSNRRILRRFEYLEPPRQAPLRLALGVGLLTYIGMLMVAAYYDQIGLSLGQIWLLTLAVPVTAAAALFGWIRRAQAAPPVRFDPTGENAPPA